MKSAAPFNCNRTPDVIMLQPVTATVELAVGKSLYFLQFDSQFTHNSHVWIAPQLADYPLSFGNLHFTLTCSQLILCTAILNLRVCLLNGPTVSVSQVGIQDLSLQDFSLAGAKSSHGMKGPKSGSSMDFSFPWSFCSPELSLLKKEIINELSFQNLAESRH